LHAIDWLLTAARLLLWVAKDRLSSKSEAADWALRHARGNWREFLPKAGFLRLNPAQAGSAEWNTWLASLDEPIQQATSELAAAARMTGVAGK
jgi:hypothetical protein